MPTRRSCAAAAFERPFLAAGAAASFGFLVALRRTHQAPRRTHQALQLIAPALRHTHQAPRRLLSRKIACAYFCSPWSFFAFAMFVHKGHGTGGVGLDADELKARSGQSTSVVQGSKKKPQLLKPEMSTKSCVTSYEPVFPCVYTHLWMLYREIHLYCLFS